MTITINKPMVARRAWPGGFLLLCMRPDSPIQQCTQSLEITAGPVEMFSGQTGFSLLGYDDKTVARRLVVGLEAVTAVKVQGAKACPPEQPLLVVPHEDLGIFHAPDS